MQLIRIKGLFPLYHLNKYYAPTFYYLGIILCHARMHGFIYDGRLWACQSCLLGLMYVVRLLYAIRCFRVMACLGFQLVDNCMKGQTFPFSYWFF
jgi:hypothetical protein